MDLTEQILQQLTAIKWLLVGISCFAALTTLLFFVLVMSVLAVMRENRPGIRQNSRETKFEDLRAAGDGVRARSAAMEWLADEPKRPSAHWALAKAHHQLGQLADSKEVLEGLLKIAPDQRFAVEDWLAHVEREFNQNRPRPV